VHLFFLLLVLAFFRFADIAQVESPLPRFESYRVEEHYPGKARPPLLTTHEDRKYRTMLKEAGGQEANFAGHYVVTMWGCGASCVMGAVVDAKTGRVYWLPCYVVGDMNESEPIAFRPDSSLIIFKGSRNEKAMAFITTISPGAIISSWFERSKRRLPSEQRYEMAASDRCRPSFGDRLRSSNTPSSASD